MCLLYSKQCAKPLHNCKDRLVSRSGDSSGESSQLLASMCTCDSIIHEPLTSAPKMHHDFAPRPLIHLLAVQNGDRALGLRANAGLLHTTRGLELPQAGRGFPKKSLPAAAYVLQKASFPASGAADAAADMVYVDADADWDTKTSALLDGLPTSCSRHGYAMSAYKCNAAMVCCQ